MKAIKIQTGFTIVETLIVLAITGFLFISTASLVSGQVARNQRRSGLVQLRTTISDKINDISSGYFTDVSTAPGNCSANASGKAAGTNENCDILGKRLTFKGDNVVVETIAKNTVTPTPEQYLSAETIYYPNSLVKSYPVADQIIDVRYTNKGVQITNSGGAVQGTDFTMCFENNTAKFTFGARGSTAVKMQLEVATCP